METELEEDLRALRASLEEMDALLALPAEALARGAPGVSGWTAEQHLAHAALANELVARNVASLVRGAGALVVDGGEPPEEALAILAAGRIPRGRAQAPRMVRPPETLQRESLEEWVAASRRELERLAGDPGAIRGAARKVPHQILGPLTASQWIRFAATHTRHHLEIAREVLAGADRPPPAP